jgi:hypothetical protein
LGSLLKIFPLTRLAKLGNVGGTKNPVAFPLVLQSLITFDKAWQPVVGEPEIHGTPSAYFTVNKAAKFLSVSASMLRNWDRTGKGASVRHPVNGYHLYRREDLEKPFNCLRPRGTEN